jgi:hypothetical protein
MTAVMITAIIALILISIILAVIIYNQMLLLNQVNKRLLLMTKESIENERMTMDELQTRLDEFESEYPVQHKQTTVVDHLGEDEEPFDPHTFDPTTLD